MGMVVRGRHFIRTNPGRSHGINYVPNRLTSWHGSPHCDRGYATYFLPFRRVFDGVVVGMCVP